MRNIQTNGYFLLPYDSIVVTIVSIDSNVLKTIFSELKFQARRVEYCFNKNKENILIDGHDDESSVAFLEFPSSIPRYLLKMSDNTIFKEHERFRKVYALNETIASMKNNPAQSITIVISSNTFLSWILKDIKNSIPVDMWSAQTDERKFYFGNVQFLWFHRKEWTTSRGV